MLGFSLVMQAAEIRFLRDQYGWTQRELADRLGTDSVTVSRWERGVSKPRPSARASLTELLNPLPSDVHALVKRIGVAQATGILRRELLLKRRLPRQLFAANPTRRLREVDRAQKEQIDLKARVRFSR